MLTPGKFEGAIVLSDIFAFKNTSNDIKCKSSSKYNLICKLNKNESATKINKYNNIVFQKINDDE